MNYQQTIKSDGSIDPNSIIVINDDGTRGLAFAGSDAWTAYRDWITAGNSPRPVFADLTASDAVAALASSIDARVAAIYSNWTRFEVEYQMREAAAQAFKNGGYVGDPGIWVTSFASAAGLGYQQAADTILSQANMLNTALCTLAALRMRKYEVIHAPDAASAQTTYIEIITAINQVAASLS